MLSFNKFIVEPVDGDRALRANNTSGFAIIEQRTALKSMKTVMDAHVVVGNDTQFIEKGSLIFVREERMFEPGWQSKIYKANEMDHGVMIVDPSFVEFIQQQSDLSMDMEDIEDMLGARRGPRP